MKYLKNLLIIAMLISLSCFISSASAAENDLKSKEEVFREELISIFPEYGDILSSPSIQKRILASERTLVANQTKNIDGKTEYSIAVFDDGTYVAAKTSGTYSWHTSSSSSGGGYVSYVGTLVASGSKFLPSSEFVSDVFTVPTVAYTIIDQDYDYFNEVSDATVFSGDRIAPEIDYDETSRGSASAQFLDYSASEFTLHLYVGGDRFKVTLDGVTLQKR